MYLSRLHIRLDSAQARRDIANPYELHRTLSLAFARGGNERPAAFLWRAESDRALQRLLVLVQSVTEPKWDDLEARFPGYLAGFDVKAYPLADRLHTGQILRFRLHANPTVTRQGKRHGLRSTMRQLEWLSRQGTGHGFTVVDCTVSSARLLRARQEAKRNTIAVQGVTYDGLLRVDEPARLQEAITAGLGHAKALGLGLLSVAPVKRQ
jgi:CRISPR system Cascade subunit CasE